MFAVACAALSIAGPFQGPRWEVVRAAARYDALLVKPPAGAPPEAQRRAIQLAHLVQFLQLEARELWRLGLKGGNAELDPPALFNTLQASRDIVNAVQALDHPAGMSESYWIQATLVERLARMCAEVKKTSVSPWAWQLPRQVELTRNSLRAAYLPIILLN
jgi:hypothetical protein